MTTKISMTDHPIIFKGDMILAIITCAGCGTVTLEIKCPKCGSKKRLKTQTRRIIKLNTSTLPNTEGRLSNEGVLQFRCPPENMVWRDMFWGNDRGPKNQHCKPIRCPYGVPGDLLWVRETWGLGTGGPGESPNIQYRGAPPWCLPCPKERIGEWGALWAKHNAKWRPSIFMPKWACRLWLKVKSVRAERVQEISEADAKAEGVSPENAQVHNIGGAYQNGFGVLWDSINKDRGFGWDVNNWVFVVEFERAEKEQ